MEYVAKVTNSKAITSMVLGIVSLIVPFVGLATGPLAIIFASKSRKEIQRNPSQSGEGLAVTGLVTGIIGSVAYAIVAAVVFLPLIFGALGLIGSSTSY